MIKRREFLNKSLMGATGLMASSGILRAGKSGPLVFSRLNDGSSIRLLKDHVFKPLEKVSVQTDKQGTMVVLDAGGREYFRTGRSRDQFPASGSLGHHLILLLNEKEQIIDLASFQLDCHTMIEDSTGKYKTFLNKLFYTLTRDYFNGREGVKLWNNKIYRSWGLTPRSHAYGLKGMKYFYPHVKEWMDAFASSQREDGMIFDYFEYRDRVHHMELRFPPDFYEVVEDGKYIFARQPVMNDVEHTFIHGVYNTWKCTGDHEWMKGKLDHCIRAVKFATSSPYTWSDKYRLIKRTFTIDTWDYQSGYDAAFFGGDIFMAEPGISEYGIMFGDNTGMAVSCYNLGEMLDFAGRSGESRQMKDLADELLERLGKISWNGEYYTMFVPENPHFKRDFDIDPDQVISLSNAFSLNRRIDHEKSVSIIKTYQRLREKTKKFAPAEWYCIYPPFTKGFETEPWYYVNGSVSSMVAGELAHGAFEHGFEAYGAGIIERVIKLSKNHDKIPGAWRGKIPEIPQRKFFPVDFRSKANISLHEIPMELADADQTLRGRKEFMHIPFQFADPSGGHKKSLVLLSEEHSSVNVELNRKAASVYFLHTMSGGDIAGTACMHFADGARYRQYIKRGEHIDTYRDPEGPDKETRHDTQWRVAFARKNKKGLPTGMVVYGMNNPHPEKTIRSLELEAGLEGAGWLVAGLTLCDHEVFFMPSGLSGGIPDPWACGSMAYALMEGLAGIYDQGANYSKIKIVPRWISAGEKQVDVTAKYEAGGGYVSCQYRHEEDEIRISLASCAEERLIKIFLPPGREPESVIVNDEVVDFHMETIENSVYAVFHLRGINVHRMVIKM